MFYLFPYLAQYVIIVFTISCVLAVFSLGDMSENSHLLGISQFGNASKIYKIVNHAISSIPHN